MVRHHKDGSYTETESKILAEIRELYKDAEPWLRNLELKRCTDSTKYLAVEALIAPFLNRNGLIDPEEPRWDRMSKPAVKALTSGCTAIFGKDLPHVYFAAGTCPHTMKRGSHAFSVESDAYPASPMRLGAGEAQAARTLRRERRQQDDDIVSRPIAEGGSAENAPGELTEGAEAEGGNTRYLSELLSMGSAPELLRLKLYPDAKELTESFAAFRAVRTHLSSAFRPDDPEVTVVCVGDGSLPRTAALFAFRTKWQCYAVDPQMRDPGPSWHGVDRCEAQTKMIQDCKFKSDKLLIVCVHAHVGLAECLAATECNGVMGIVAMPCCNFYARKKLPSPYPPVAEYRDNGIVSPHRLVRVYMLNADDLKTVCLTCSDSVGGSSEPAVGTS